MTVTLEELEGGDVPCSEMVRYATMYEPPEFCDLPATRLVDGEPYCDGHAAYAAGEDV